MRLHHFLALAGVASRRRCEKLIAAGRVSVNGSVQNKLGTKIDPDNDVVLVDNERVQVEKKVYILLNKPSGYLTTVTDSRGRPTVIDLLDDPPARLYPVGRLDKDTEGLLLITNDGALCHKLTHPRFGVEKTYIAQVSGKPSEKTLDRLRKGVEIEDGRTAPAKISLIESASDSATLEIVIHEGRKRQVKRMCKAMGHKVIRLKRVEFGGLKLGRLKPGQYRFLSQNEVAKLSRKVFPDAR